ncbi:MAG: prepilin-type N-terminal cleavage/methylation domain-containing protein [Candidatus Ratteibacteria bacterium]
MKRKQSGFTLLEMLVVIVVGFIIIFLVYQTMSTTLKVSGAIREKIAETQRINFFLNSFVARMLCVVPDSENNSFQSNQVSVELNEYQSRKIIMYSAELNENGKYNLNVTEKDIFLNTEFSYPAITDLDSVEFSFFDGETWSTLWDKDTIPAGIAITLEIRNSKIFLPVNLDIKSAQQT